MSRIDIGEAKRLQATAWARLASHLACDGSVQSVVFELPTEIVEALTPWLGLRNIAFWPPDGFRCLTSVALSSERGCIELRPSVESISIVRPRRLTFQFNNSAPLQSFLLLELASLDPVGNYDAGYASRWQYEELMEIAGRYQRPSSWGGMFGADEDAVRTAVRRVTRWFGGQILIVSPASVLNAGRQGADGRYSTMTVDEISSLIEDLLNRP